MFVHCPVLRLRALACCAAIAAAPTFAAETTAPPALPAWPDQAPSVYTQPIAVPVGNLTAPPLQQVVPASFEVAAPPAQVAAPPTIAAPAKDPRRLAPPSDRHLPHAAKRKSTEVAAKALPTFGLPLDSMYTTVAALATVLGLFLLSAALVRRGAKKSSSMLPEEVVGVLGRVPLAARQFAELVRIGNKLVLVSVTPSGAEPLTEITDPVEIDRLVGLCRSRTKGSSTDDFDQVFRQLAEESAPVGFLGNEVPHVESRLSAPADVYAAYRGGTQRA